MKTEMNISDESENGEGEEYILPDIATTGSAKRVVDTAIPEKSKDKYIGAYENFLAWQKKQGTTSFSEPVLVAYFKGLSKKLKPSTLWSIHSMLKTTIDNKKSIDITKYTRLHRFVKKQNIGFQSKKSKILRFEEVQKFLREAPDSKYLVTKVALIIGVYGACRGGELCRLTINNVIDKHSLLQVTLPDTKTHLPRTFVIDGEYYRIVRKYMDLRPQNAIINRFFINYQSGKCTQQPIGKNKLSSMPAQIAQYLNLPDAKCYTGHSFRRTSASILADAGADMIAIKRLSGWKSDLLADRYIDGTTNETRKGLNQQIELIDCNSSISNTTKSTIPQLAEKKKIEDQVRTHGPDEASKNRPSNLSIEVWRLMESSKRLNGEVGLSDESSQDVDAGAGNAHRVLDKPIVPSPLEISVDEVKIENSNDGYSNEETRYVGPCADPKERSLSQQKRNGDQETTTTNQKRAKMDEVLRRYLERDESGDSGDSSTQIRAEDQPETAENSNSVWIFEAAQKEHNLKLKMLNIELERAQLQKQAALNDLKTSELKKKLIQNQLEEFHSQVRMSGEPGSGAGKGGGGGGSIREAGGAFGKMEAAREDQYFYNQQKEQLTQLRESLHDEISFHEEQIKRHQEAIARHKNRIGSMEKK